MEAPFFPVGFGTMRAQIDFTSGKPAGQKIGSAKLIPIPLSHPNGGWGLRLEEKGKSFVFLTDNELEHRHEGGLTQGGYVDACARADLMIHDAQYTEAEYPKKKTWGHSTYTQALRLALSARAKRIGFFHHDPDRTDDDIDRLVASARSLVASEGRRVACFAAREGQEIVV
jgi:ribonuclease BN (tRNA processing enzyme)